MVQQCPRCGQLHEPYAGCAAIAGAAPGRATLIGADEALVGNVVAERYQVGDILGKGGTGTVFAIEHLSFPRAAAMKVLRPHYAAEDLVSRVFHGEARAAWSVLHPNLCEVFDIGALPDGAPFFVMERLEGETLATRIARERLSVAAAVDVAMQMLSAISAIHARDLLLRDLRPQNIYLAQRRGCRPLLKILDFGLARLTPLEAVQAEWDARTAASDRVGAGAIPYYLSPERTRGEHGIEPASDLFIAAVIFYEALTGARPFSGTSFEGVLFEICQGGHVPLAELRPDLPPELTEFVNRTLSPSPRNRPGSAKEMQEELRAIFERGGSRRASVSMQAVAPISVSGVPSSIAAAAAALASTSVEIQRPAVTYEDTTRTDQSLRIPIPSGMPHVPRVNAESLTPEDISTASRTLDPAILDEASAESAERTVPPPRPDTDPPFAVEVDAALSLLTATPAGVGGASVSDEDEASIAIIITEGGEEETETMRLAPELRQRVDELLAATEAVTNPASSSTALPRPQPPPPLPQRSGAKPRT